MYEAKCFYCNLSPFQKQNISLLRNDQKCVRYQSIKEYMFKNKEPILGHLKRERFVEES